MVDPKWLTELEDKARAATPGPWKADLGNWQIESANQGDCYRDGICCFTHSDRDGVNGRTNPINPIDDAEFIEAMNPAQVLALLKLVREMGDQLGYLTKECNCMSRCGTKSHDNSALIGYQRGPRIGDEEKG